MSETDISIIKKTRLPDFPSLDAGLRERFLSSCTSRIRARLLTLL